MYYKVTVFSVLILVVMYTIIPATSNGDLSLIHGLEVTCEKLYFINYIHIVNSTINETLVLETPGNISLPYGFKQTSLIVYQSEGLRFNETLGAIVFDVREAESFTGYFVVELNVCAPDRKTLFNYVALAQIAPYLSTPPLSPNVPNNPPDVEHYLIQPHQIVASRVKEDFENWLDTTYRGVKPSNLSSFALSVLAASFIYGYYIRYNASPYPRSIEDVVETGTGDCDDMSRVLVELLNVYGIPSIMITGYDVVWNNYTIDVEGFKYRYVNNGPHAFAAAYIQGVGWVSLDLLAGGMLTYPFIVEGYGRSTTVNQTAVEEFKDLHKKIAGTQLMAVLKEDVVRGYLENRTLGELIRSLVEFEEENPVSTTTPISTNGEDVTLTPSPGESPAGNMRDSWKWVILTVAIGAVFVFLSLLASRNIKKTRAR